MARGQPPHRRRRPRDPGYRGQPNGGLDALLNPAAGEPGAGAWRPRHGDKLAQTFCGALRAARVLRGRERHRRDDPINVYPCRLGATADAPPIAPLHWHVGHLRPGARHYTSGVVLIAEAC